MVIKSKKSSVKVSSEILTESQKKKLKKKEKLLSTNDATTENNEAKAIEKKEEVDVILPIGEPSNDIDKAAVTLSEFEYERLKSIELNLRELFKAAGRQKLYVGLGKNKKAPDTKEAQEGKVTTKLRKLVDM